MDRGRINGSMVGGSDMEKDQMKRGTSIIAVARPTAM
jgi:hypothetical protein